MRKFILDNQIKFLKDSVSVDWLTTFSLDVELAKLVIIIILIIGRIIRNANMNHLR